MKKNILQIVTVMLLILSLVSCQTANTNNTESSTQASSKEVMTSQEQNEKTESTETEPIETEVAETEEIIESENADLTLDSPVKLVALKGPTAMGLAGYTAILQDLETESDISDLDMVSANSADVDYEIMTMPDQVATGLIKGEIDLACIPANLAATVYNKSEGKIQVAAINVSNVLYFATNNVELNSLEDLQGKTIYSTGQGATPEVILTNLLSKAGLTIGTDVTINFYPEATEVASLLQAEDGAIALLPEPFLSSVLLKNEQIHVALDVNELWNEYFPNDIDENNGITTGVLVVQKDFAAQNSEWFEQFLADYQASTEWVNQNPAAAAEIIGEQEIIGAAVAEKAIPNCGITFLKGEDLKSTLSPYLEILATNNPELVGGELPEADFYY